MFSFLNGKSPFDEAEEKLEAGEVVNGRPKLPKAPAMGWQDGLFLLVIIALIVGGYEYYQYSKAKSAETFARCDAHYVAAAEKPEMLLEAEACYDSTWNLGFVSDSMEVLRQNRLGEITDKRTLMKDLLADAKLDLKDGDTAKAVKAIQEYNGPMLLVGDDVEAWKQIAAMKVGETAQDSAAVAADSSVAPVVATEQK